jgi:superfamily II DNA helicase RecQ
LHAQTFPNGPLDRRGFEELLNAMARSRLVDIAEASFEKDGKRIDYRKVWLSGFGREDGAASAVLIPEEIESVPRLRPRKGRKRAGGVPAAPAPRGPRKASVVEAALKSWRLAEARRKHVPAFRILSDKTLQAIANRQPGTNSELLAVKGIGPGIAGKYGAEILRVLAGVAES